jgi:uncharacterized protein YjaZ
LCYRLFRLLRTLKILQKRIPFLIAFRRLAFILCITCGVSGFLSGEQSTSPDIVLGYDAIAAWVDVAASKQPADRTALFERLVIEKYKSQCFTGPALHGDDNQLTGMVFGNPAGWDLAQVKKEIQVLQQNKNQIVEAIQGGLTESRRRLPAKAAPRVCAFYFQPDSPVRSRMHGVMAFTPSQSLMDLYVSPVPGWLPWVGYNVAHEYHHTQWMARNPSRDTFQFTLLEYLVFEGRADNFASQTTGLSGDWSHALSAEQECTVFTSIRASLDQTGAILPKVMFGWPGSGYPQWAGYTLGFGIVHSFLKLHPDAVENWTNLSADDLFAASHYDPCAGNHSH